MKKAIVLLLVGLGLLVAPLAFLFAGIDPWILSLGLFLGASIVAGVFVAFEAVERITQAFRDRKADRMAQKLLEGLEQGLDWGKHA